MKVRVKIDPESARLFQLHDTIQRENPFGRLLPKETLRYYTTVHARALIVARNNISLELLLPHQIVEATIGFDYGSPGLVLEKNVGHPHNKLVILRELNPKETAFSITLSDFLAASPK